MFFIGGTGNKLKDLGMTAGPLCPGCQNSGGWQVSKSYGYFHLFFIPIFHFQTRYFLTCPRCGHSFSLSPAFGKAFAKGQGPVLTKEHLAPANQAVAGMAPRYCGGCGKPLAMGDHFCPNCGRKA